MKRSLFVLALAALAVSAHAEMYRYYDPETGRTKLTNIPPKPGTPMPPGAAADAPGPATRPPSAATPVGQSAPPSGRATRERRFAVGERGFIVLTVPDAWVDELRPDDPRLPPTIVLRPGSGPPFEVLLTPIPPPRENAPRPTPESVREFVRGISEKVKSEVVERDIPIRALTGPQATGAYFAVTDRAPKPNEYKYMTQGMLALAELRVTFTVLTNDGQEKIPPQALEMLKGARHEAGTTRAQSVAAPPRQAGARLELSTPGLAWSVAIPRDDWVVQHEKRRSDGGGTYYFVTSETKPTPFSIYFDRTTKCTSGESCRERFWRTRGADFRDARDVRRYERNGFHVVQFWVDFGAAGGMPFKQANVSAHLYRDGYWVDLRISRLEREVPDPAPLLELLDSVVVR